MQHYAGTAFGSGGPPADRNDRQDAVEAVEAGSIELWENLDQKFFAYPDDSQRLLENYVDRVHG